MIRPSQVSDMPAITAIYAHHVIFGTGTFEVEPPSLEDMTSRREEVLARRLPYLVVEIDGQVKGYAYCNWFKPRPAFRYSAEDSIYLADDIAGKGWGKKLLMQLCEESEKAGLRKMIAVIGDSDNAGSIGVHASLGFQHLGTISGCGWKFDRWLDIVMMEKELGLGQNQPPPDGD